MFTGLIKELGTISKIEKNSEGSRITINSKTLIDDIDIDDSVAVNGACQTVVEKGPSHFVVQAVHVTLEKTNFNFLKVGDSVNLELALRLSDRLGGHLVQGHVNGVGVLKAVEPTGKNILLSVEIPRSLTKYVLDEGSIAIDGISLTVAKFIVDKNLVQVSIIPHTWENTVLEKRKIGDKLNIEVDILAKYLENLVLRGENSSKISKHWLADKGFL